MTLVYLACAWLTGLYIASLIHLALWIPGAAGLLCALATLIWMRRSHPHPDKVRLPHLLSALLLTMTLGMWRYDLARPALLPGPLAAYNDGEPVNLRGVIVNAPTPSDRITRLHLAVSEMNTGGSWTSILGVVLVQVPSFDTYRYGDRLEVQGVLRTPESSTDSSYRDYLARQGIHSVMTYARISFIAQGQGHPFLAWLYAIKGHTQVFIASTLAEPQAALLSGILLGSDEGIPRTLMEQFSRAGTAHIIAISGFNIALVSAALVRLFSRVLQRYVALAAAVVAIVLYTILVGAEPPVVRAAIMGGMTALALIVGRQSDALTSLFAAAWLMSIGRPFLPWDISFQISFAATLGLICYGERITRVAEAIASRIVAAATAQRIVWLLRDTLLATLAAQITVLPLLAYHFGEISPLGLLANLLILPVQPAIVYLGGAAALLGQMLRPLGVLLGWFVWVPLTYTIRVTEVVADWIGAPGAQGKASLAFVLVYYGILALVTWLPSVHLHPGQWLRALREHHSVRRAAFVALLALVTLVWVAVASLPDQRLHVSFLDVGQGDAILIRTPSGQRLLIDGGPSPALLLQALGRRLPFWDRRVDLVLSTHSHDDHLRGLLAVTERYQVRMAISGTSVSDSAVAQAWQQRLESLAIPHQVVDSPLEVDLGDGFSLQLIPLDSEDSPGETWLLMRLAGMGRGLLLTGDLEAESLLRAARSGWPLSCSVLKVPHHGSADALSPTLLDALQPELAIISVGANNRFGHPDTSTMDLLGERQVDILRTDLQGDIEIVVDGGGWRVETQRN
jgi:competence protein ComEC